VGDSAKWCGRAVPPLEWCIAVYFAITSRKFVSMGD